MNGQTYLGSEVVDAEGTSFGILDCFWYYREGEPAFFGVKTAMNSQTSIVPGELVEFSPSGLRILTHRELVQHGPSLPCEEPISPEFESALRDYYGAPQPVEIRRGNLRKKARQLDPTCPTR
jgi:hypothetical protein